MSDVELVIVGLVSGQVIAFVALVMLGWLLS